MWLFVVLLGVCGFLFQYVKKNYDFWDLKGVPNTGSISCFVYLIHVIFGGKKLEDVCTDIYRSFPRERFVGTYDLCTPNLIIRDASLVNHVLVSDFDHFQSRRSNEKTTVSRLRHHLLVYSGSKWKSLRQKFNPVFTPLKIKTMFNLVEYCCDILMSNTEKITKNDEPIDVHEMMCRFTTDIIGTCFFGLEFNTLSDPESQYRQIGKRTFAPTFKTKLGILIRYVSPSLLKSLNISEIPAEVESFFFDLLKRTEEHRKTAANRRNDLMQLMLDIKEREMNDVSKKKHENDVLFDDKTMASSIFLFYAAGFETSASTLSFCLYELGLHPEIQDKVRAEIIKVKADHDGKITYDALKKLTYMEMVLLETLRLHAPISLLNRVCTKTYRIPDSNVTLHPGDRITIPSYALHHDAKYYPHPDKFDPERFSEENNKKRIPGTYIPFGDGPRICIGVRFAKVEMKMGLSSLLLKYKFEKCDETEIPIKIHPRRILYTPKGAIYLKVTKIQEQ